MTCTQITLAALPQDILLLVLAYLDAPSLLCLQLTSRLYHSTFTDPVYLRLLLRFYPHARYLLPCKPDASDASLLRAFTTLAARTYHLSLPRPRTLQHIDLRALDQSGHWYPTPQWDYHESQPGGRLYHEHAAGHLMGIRNATSFKPYLFRPSLWSYSDGMLVYAPAQTDGGGGKAKERVLEDRCLRVLDLESGEVAEVPFDVRGKIIRNIRVKEAVLVVEWAERDAYHDLNMVDKVHRHFATAYDVIITHEAARPDVDASSITQQSISNRTNVPPNATILTVTFRNEWKIHFLGLPLSSRDYFFSTHTSTHWAMYYWQPNRSLWTSDEDQPIEALFIWSISSPSPYRPSEDPSNTRTQRDPNPTTGPRCLARYSMRELEFLGIRQHASISFMKISLDSDAQTLTWWENRFVSGQGYFDPAERCWQSTSTAFPFVGLGCVLRRTGEAGMVSYRGHCSMESGMIEADVERWFLPVCEAGDEGSPVRFGLIETCFTGMMIENRVLIRVRSGEDGEWRNLEDDVVGQLGAMGRIAGDERWLVGQNERLQIVIARFQ